MVYAVIVRVSTTFLNDIFVFFATCIKGNLDVSNVSSAFILRVTACVSGGC
jgi:hypothetical protein